MPSQLVQCLLERYAEIESTPSFHHYPPLQVVDAVQFLRDEELVRCPDQRDVGDEALELTESGWQVLEAMLEDPGEDVACDVWEWDGDDIDFPTSLKSALDKSELYY